MANLDRISEIYKNRTIFITGGTGFIGKVLIEKLLRTTEVKKIYLLIREKRGKFANQRIKEIFDNNLFDLLKKENPNAMQKCKAIFGDFTAINLGISDINRKLLANEVNYIFHSAASIKFDDSVKYAVTMNTRGTKFMLDLARQCKNLKLFVYVSSTYVFPVEDVLYEKFYEPPADPNEIIKIINSLTEETAEDRKKLLGNLPNTYTYSKALAEKLVQDQVGKMPIIIERISIVGPTWLHPLPGWCNSLQGPAGLLAAGGKGILRSIYIPSPTTASANIIPVDMAINGMLVATWYYFHTNKEFPVYHICTPKEDLRDLTWKSLLELIQEALSTEMPLNGVLWYPNLRRACITSRILNDINHILYHMLPALFVDALLFGMGRKPYMWKLQIKHKSIIKNYEFSTGRNWNFDTATVRKLRKCLNSDEKKNYKIDSEGFNGRQYLINSIKGTRHYLKETDDTIPAARRHMKIMYVVDKICKGLLIGGLIKFIYLLSH